MFVHPVPFRRSLLLLLLRVIIHPLLLTVLSIRMQGLTLAHCSEHRVQTGGIVRDESYLCHSTISLALIPTVIIATSGGSRHWSSIVIHKSYIYHKVETFLVELCEVPGDGV